MNRLFNNLKLGVDLNKDNECLYKTNYGIFISFFEKDYSIYHQCIKKIHRNKLFKLKDKSKLLGINLKSISDEFVMLELNITSYNEKDDLSAQFSIIINEIINRLDRNEFECEVFNRELFSNIKLYEG